MPTILRIKSYRFHFYSDEQNEPAHIHIETGDGECKYWIDPIKLARNKGIPSHKLRDIEKIIFENQVFIKEKYFEYHNR